MKAEKAKGLAFEDACGKTAVSLTIAAVCICFVGMMSALINDAKEKRPARIGRK